jgi:hypothetical protein
MWRVVVTFAGGPDEGEAPVWSFSSGSIVIGMERVGVGKKYILPRC